MTDAAIVYCTTASREDALKIGHMIVSERLAACANVLGEATSIYEWDGVVQQSSEAVLLLKTSRDLVDRVIARVQELHSYECPAVIAWEVAAGNAAYLQWIAGQTMEADPAAGMAG